MVNSTKKASRRAIMREIDWNTFAYWHMFRCIETLDRLERKGYLPDGARENHLRRLRDGIGLNKEPIESFLNRAMIDSLKKKYGVDAESTPIPHLKARYNVRQNAGVDTSYYDFTEIVKLSGIDISSSYAIQSWLRNRGTLELFSLWEQAHNRSFDVAVAERLINRAAPQNSTLTLKHWVSETKAIGIVALQGRYGGTYAAPVIAIDFEMWISPREILRRIETILMKQEDFVRKGGYDLYP